MALPSIKTIVIATSKPFFWAMKQYYAAKVKIMQETSYSTQNEITRLQADVAHLSELIMGYNLETLALQAQMEELKRQAYTMQEAREYEARCKELSFICSHLYQIVKEKFPTEELPDWDNPMPEPVTEESGESGESESSNT